MTAQSNPFRSTVFRLAVAAVTVLMLAAAVIVYAIGGQANRIITQATEDAIQADAAQLRTEYASGGIDALGAIITERSRHASGALYLLVDASGRRRAGNLAERPHDIRGGARSGIFSYRLAGAIASDRSLAAGLIIDVDANGSILVVARDIENQRGLLTSIDRSLQLGLGALALLGIGVGYLLARHVLRRIDGMRRAAVAIMAGNLAGRLPLAGSGDELDRLGQQLNNMLERIERLMSGLREVSDNIAHDLKTPLNRLRNSAESALSDTRGGPAWREGLERTIEEADGLISTFNALLLIARLEAGAIEESLQVFDLAEVAGDVAELYAPVAEDRGLKLDLAMQPPIPIHANRQLVSQAIANLIDNAIKYASTATPGDLHKPIVEIAVCVENGEAVLIVADHGPGIPAADRARALKRFVRLEASRTRPGTGLGLSLVAAVAQLAHGSIRLEDNKPGLRVVLTLPLAAVPQSVAHSGTAARQWDERV